MKHWKEKYSAGGVCDFRENYDFYFKWLLNKVCSCFVINGLPDTINQTYLKNELILSGMCCVTDFGGKLYACTGSLGGQPDEYYIPTVFVIANPVLGSKQVRIKELPVKIESTGSVKGGEPNGVVIFNTAIDELYNGCFAAGLYQYINQTATLLADNIVSINANQINSRVCAFFVADSKAKALAGEVVLKKMYAGQPYQILEADLVEKINVNPISTASTSSNITELVELNNYIISNFMQSIGIKANNDRKRERMITDEINSQNDYLGFSVLEVLASWQKGFDAVNKMYGTEISVSLSPAVADVLTSCIVPRETEPEETAPAEDADSIEPEDENQQEPEPAEDADSIEEPEEETPEQIAEEIELQAEEIKIIAEAAAGVNENESLQDALGESGDLAEDSDSGGDDSA